jgi:hypothetical protein
MSLVYVGFTTTTIQKCSFEFLTEGQFSGKHYGSVYSILSRYAEIRYTQGGYEHLEMAKSYYSHAVRLNPNNMRALYGLLQVELIILETPTFLGICMVLLNVQTIDFVTPLLSGKLKVRFLIRH